MHGGMRIEAYGGNQQGSFLLIRRLLLLLLLVILLGLLELLRLLSGRRERLGQQLLHHRPDVFLNLIDAPRSYN